MAKKMMHFSNGTSTTHSEESWANKRYVDERLVDSPVSRERRLEVALAIVDWSASVMTYLDRGNWEFAVDSDGKYLPGRSIDGGPVDFVHEAPGWRLTLDTPCGRGDCPNTPIVLTHDRTRIHDGISRTVINLVGVAKANRMLAYVRQAFRLGKPTRKALKIDGPLLF